MDTITLTADDGAEVDVLVWRPSGEPRGLVQIAHGMAEYAARYDRLGRRLAEEGWLVVANDHRGHGPRAAALRQLGQFPDRGYHQLLDDLSLVADHFRAELGDRPWFLVGHSMGSFLVRVLAGQRGRELAGLVVIGTGASAGVLGGVGTAIAHAQVLLAGEDSSSPLLNNLAFGSFNRAFRPARTDFDWLSRDREEVDRYVDDPLCGYVCTAGFYRELFRLSEVANSIDVMRATPPQLPVALFSGSLDPVGGSGRGVRRVAQQLRSHGVRRVDLTLYPDARHEILNETNRDEVVADIVDWIDTVARTTAH